MGANKKKTFYFFLAIFLFTFISSLLIFGMINLKESSFFLTIFWMIGFIVLTINIGYMFTCTLIACTTKEPILEEKPVSEIPKTAIVYVVRNEHPEVLRKNLAYSIENNYQDNIDLWLLSNSDDEEFIENEQKVLSELRKKFGNDRIGYFQTFKNHLRRKHICIHQWLNTYRQYKYFLVCDADSQIPQGALLKFVSKAEHPDNRSIVLFQSKINIHEKTTYFNKFLAIGQDICQRIYSRANQKVFGRAVSYGSSCLIRCKEFKEINVPDWVLSHDIWDTVYLEEKNYHVVFCGDVVTYGSFPNNYIEYLKRSQRWIKGTLESLPVCLKKNIPAGTRFMVLYPSYMYAIQPLFLLWIMSGFFYNNTMWKTMFVTQKYAFLGGSFVDLEMGSHMFITMGIVAGHRFVKCRSIKEVALVFVELFSTLLLCLNTIVFDSISVVKWLFTRKKGMQWVSMKKGPEQKLFFIDVVKSLWPITLFGIICLVLGVVYSPLWALFASPFLCSFIFGIPVTYFTSKRLSNYRAPKM
ncbi:glycosyltransferase [bacterium]|nr:glycosyltransferase [bacterium]